EVSGRTYPVEVRNRPLVPDTEDAGEGDGDGDRELAAQADTHDQPTAICSAVDELAAEGPGDIPVFHSSVCESRDTHVAHAHHLRARYVPPYEGRAQPPSAVQVIPLYARLSAAEQHRVFEPHTTRRVVLATNVAETSLTVPGIRYVVDPGTARISRYSNRT